MLFTIDAQADNVFPLDFAHGVHRFEHAHQLCGADDLHATSIRFKARRKDQVHVLCRETTNVCGNCQFDGSFLIRRDRWIFATSLRSCSLLITIGVLARLKACG